MLPKSYLFSEVLMGGGLLFLQLLLGTIAVVFCNLNCPTINALPVQICSATITWMRGENKFKSYIDYIK